MQNIKHITIETPTLKYKPIRLGNIYGDQFGNSFGGNVWDKNGVAPTLKTGPSAAQQFIMEIKNMEYIGTYQYGKSDKFMQGKSRFIENKRISDCLQTKQKEGVALNNNGNIRIRKLTPTECYKLQGFTAEDCKKASEAGVSNSQLYKQAGNSICVSVLEAIYKSLGERYDEFKPLS